MSENFSQMILIRTDDATTLVYKEDVVVSKMYVYSDLTCVFKNEEEAKEYYSEYADCINDWSKISSSEEFISILEEDILVYYLCKEFTILNFNFDHYEYIPYQEITVEEVYYKNCKYYNIHVFRDVENGKYYFCTSSNWADDPPFFKIFDERSEFSESDAEDL